MQSPHSSPGLAGSPFPGGPGSPGWAMPPDFYRSRRTGCRGCASCLLLLLVIVVVGVIAMQMLPGVPSAIQTIGHSIGGSSGKG